MCHGTATIVAEILRKPYHFQKLLQLVRYLHAQLHVWVLVSTKVNNQKARHKLRSWSGHLRSVGIDLASTSTACLDFGLLEVGFNWSVGLGYACKLTHRQL